MTYEGPTEIGHYKLAGRGTSYFLKIADHEFQIWITEKRKLVRVFVDHEEWAPA